MNKIKDKEPTPRSLSFILLALLKNLAYQPSALTQPFY